LANQAGRLPLAAFSSEQNFKMPPVIEGLPMVTVRAFLWSRDCASVARRAMTTRHTCFRTQLLLHSARGSRLWEQTAHAPIHLTRYC